jgi:hypothetical protein
VRGTNSDFLRGLRRKLCRIDINNSPFAWRLQQLFPFSPSIHCTPDTGLPNCGASNQSEAGQRYSVVSLMQINAMDVPASFNSDALGAYRRAEVRGQSDGVMSWLKAIPISRWLALVGKVIRKATLGGAWLRIARWLDSGPDPIKSEAA